jgi:hypothetical protein
MLAVLTLTHLPSVSCTNFCLCLPVNYSTSPFYITELCDPNFLRYQEGQAQLIDL